MNHSAPHISPQTRTNLGANTSVNGPTHSYSDNPGLSTEASAYFDPLRDPQSPEDLRTFRHGLGIYNDPLFSGATRSAANIGIYDHVVNYEKQYQRSYSHFLWLINGSMGVQLVLSAAITALSAGKGSYSALTAFGAMNTIVAGFLASLKGSGLPNRYKYYQTEWSKVREHIEQREREFSLGRKEMLVERELEIVQSMYDCVKGEIEANRPDNFVSLTAVAKKADASPLSAQAKDWREKVRLKVETKSHHLNEKLDRMENAADTQINRQLDEGVQLSRT
jgi:hypothetical protein